MSEFDDDDMPATKFLVETASLAAIFSLIWSLVLWIWFSLTNKHRQGEEGAKKELSPEEYERKKKEEDEEREKRWRAWDEASKKRREEWEKRNAGKYRSPKEERLALEYEARMREIIARDREMCRKCREGQ